MTKSASRYSSYLLRIGHSAEGDPQGWRFSLQDLETGERLGFATLESLFTFFETANTEVTNEANAAQRKEAEDQSELNNDEPHKPRVSL
jgi:hypothetical protein